MSCSQEIGLVGREPTFRDYIDEAYMWGDLRDYELMALREREKYNARMHAWECWELHRRRWFPSGWGL